MLRIKNHRYIKGTDLERIGFGAADQVKQACGLRQVGSRGNRLLPVANAIKGGDGHRNLGLQSFRFADIRLVRAVSDLRVEVRQHAHRAAEHVHGRRCWWQRFEECNQALGQLPCSREALAKIG